MPLFRVRDHVSLAFGPLPHCTPWCLAHSRCPRIIYWVTVSLDNLHEWMLLPIISFWRKEAEICGHIIRGGKSILIVDDTEYIKAVLSHHTLSLFNIAFKQLFLLAK